MTGAPSEVWWGREAEPGDRPPMVPGPGPAGVQPELVDGHPGVGPRRRSGPGSAGSRPTGPTWPATTPASRWSACSAPWPSRCCAGSTACRRRRWSSTCASPASSRCRRPRRRRCWSSPSRPPPARSVLVPPGYQAGAAPATGQGEQVVFETEHAVQATPADHRRGSPSRRRGLVAEVDLGAAAAPAVRRLRRATRGRANALWVGLALDRRRRRPVAVGVAGARGRPRPPARPRRRPAAGSRRCRCPRRRCCAGSCWTAAGAVPVEVLRDETGGLRRSGVVELRPAPLLAAGPAARRAGAPGAALAAGRARARARTRRRRRWPRSGSTSSRATAARTISGRGAGAVRGRPRRRAAPGCG